MREEDERSALGKGELEQETVMEMLKMTENLNSMESRDNTLAEEKDGGVRARGAPRMAQRIYMPRMALRVYTKESKPGGAFLS